MAEAKGAAAAAVQSSNAFVDDMDDPDFLDAEAVVSGVLGASTASIEEATRKIVVHRDFYNRFDDDFDDDDVQ